MSIKSKIRVLAHDLMTEHGLVADGWTFDFNQRKTSCGLCSYSKKEITLSVHYIGKVDIDTTKNTILHEIAHALVGSGHGHDNIWRRKAIEIGCTGNRTANTSVQVEGKYVATCPSCGIVVYKHRKPKNDCSCAKCCPTRYNSKYKFTYELNPNYPANKQALLYA